MSIKQLLTECEKEVTGNKNLIEELKRTLEHYRTLADLSPDCIFMIDRELVVRYANAAAARFLGREPQEVEGRALARLFPPSTYRAQARHLRKMFGSGIAVTSSDAIAFPNIDLFLNTKWVPVRNNAGDIAFALCISREVPRPERTGRQRETGKGPDGLEHLLSNREVQVLRLVAEGMTNKEIGDRLFISARTVDTHRTRMMKKLNAHNAPDLIRKSRRSGFIE